MRVIAAEEVSAYLAAPAGRGVAPTVVALRTMADEVVAAELARLDARRPDMDHVDVRAELERTVRRVVDKLLHAPTVRVKEFPAEEPAGLAYAEALHALFDLDPLRYREVVVADVHAVEVDLHTVEPDGGDPVTAVLLHPDPATAGTRRSALAQAQARLVARAVTAATGPARSSSSR